MGAWELLCRSSKGYRHEIRTAADGSLSDVLPSLTNDIALLLVQIVLVLDDLPSAVRSGPCGNTTA